MRRERTTTAEKVVNAIQIALWLGAISFLLWFMITEFRKVQKSASIVSSIDSKSSIPFPGILICPAAEQLRSPSNGSDVPVTTAIGIDPQQALVYLGPVFGSTTENAYVACPQLQVYSQGTFTVTCINFIQSPQKTDSDMNCSLAENQGKYATAAQFNPPSVWAATKATSSLALSATLINASHPLMPILMLFYSSKSLKSFPSSFDDYVNTFTMTASVQDIPLASRSRVLLTKQIRDRYPSDSDCSYDAYQTTSSVIHQSVIEEVNTTSDDFPSTFSVAYDTLDQESLCHRPVLTPPDVIGIIGGAIAMVVAATLFLSWLVRYFSGTSSNTHTQSNDFSALQA